MESLLRWGIENSSPSTDNAPRVPPKPLDPGIIDAILGKPDAQLMKEALQVAIDDSRSEEDRVAALDNMEMLVESIDNANDLEKLKMWQPLHDLLASPSPLVKAQTLWIIGTALQNNPSAQSSYLSLHPLDRLVSCLKPTCDPKTRAKALYALSGLLKLNSEAVKAMDAADGWETLKAAVIDPDVNVRRKASFLLNTLLLPSSPVQPPSSANSNLNTPVHPNSHALILSNPSLTSTSAIALPILRSSGFIDLIISRLAGPHAEPEGDEQAAENCLRLLYSYSVVHSASLSDPEKKKLRKWLGADGQRNAEKWGFDREEVRELRAAIW